MEGDPPARRAGRRRGAPGTWTCRRRTWSTRPGESLEGGARSFQSGNGDPERRAGKVVEAGGLEEVDRLRVAAVLPADAQVQVRLGGAALRNGTGHQRADADGIQGFEGGDRQDPEIQVRREERCLDVVTREAPRHLGEIVGAEGEEVRL